MQRRKTKEARDRALEKPDEFAPRRVSEDPVLSNCESAFSPRHHRAPPGWPLPHQGCLHSAQQRLVRPQHLHQPRCAASTCWSRSQEPDIGRRPESLTEAGPGATATPLCLRHLPRQPQHPGPRPDNHNNLNCADARNGEGGWDPCTRLREPPLVAYIPERRTLRQNYVPGPTVGAAHAQSAGLKPNEAKCPRQNSVFIGTEEVWGRGKFGVCVQRNGLASGGFAGGRGSFSVARAVALL